MTDTPRFAVVGHPNKGKSSIVATLTQNDRIAIAMEPGTTRDSHDYPLRVDGEELYRLIDTPGFQRPRRLLAWLQQHSASAADRAETVAAFVAQHSDDPRFHDECELLKPIIAGAGIIYVVDGSVPYSPEHEAEMNILRWTGQPSMALINQIGSNDHSDQWAAALAQYFRIVRPFNAVAAAFAEQLALLDSFAQLAPHWQDSLARARHHLGALREQRSSQACVLISNALSEMLQHRELTRLLPGQGSEQLEPQLRQRWQDWQRRREQQLRDAIETLYQHHQLERQEDPLAEVPADLFSANTRQLWGLPRRYLATLGFGAGALGGATVDGLTGGASLGIGTLLGGTLGAASSYYYADRLASLKLGRLSGGYREARFGPVQDPQFAYLVLSRALYHWQQVSLRNHAGRAPLQLADNDRHWLDSMDKAQRRQLHRALQQPPRHGADHKRRAQLEQAVYQASLAFQQWQPTRVPQGQP